MLECWGENSISRKQPQAIMRDINQILYQVYNSRRTHAYATAFPKLFKDTDRIDEDDSNTVESKSLNGESHTSSVFTDHTSLAWDDTDEGKSKNIVLTLVIRVAIYICIYIQNTNIIMI